MEFSHDTLIDVGLSVAGYLAAVALWMVLYSLFTGRSQVRAMAPELVGGNSPSAAGSAIGEAVREKRKLQYVDLRGSTSSNATTASSGPDTPRAEQQRRNRVQVMKLAREMLKDGRTQDQVRDLLPISEGELALLANE